MLLSAGEEKSDDNVNNINEGNKETEIIGKMLEGEISTQTGSNLLNAEIFYMECTLKNPKDIWSEFTFAQQQL